jgi:lysophospholipid acyltransferase (LPLAT)-like uncharacterized protein
VIRALASTLRVREVGENPLRLGEPFVAALWHNTLYLALGLFRDRQLVVAVSRSRAGERASALLEALGYGRPVRGSTSRAPVAALSGMLRAARAGRSVAVLVDGGHGPAHRVRPGVLAVARGSGHAIWPVGLAASPCLRLRSSWETVIVPLPFSRVVAVSGRPLRIPREADREALEPFRALLESELLQATRRAEELLAPRRGAASELPPTDAGVA